MKKQVTINMAEKRGRQRVNIVKPERDIDRKKDGEVPWTPGIPLEAPADCIDQEAGEKQERPCAPEDGGCSCEDDFNRNEDGSWGDGPLCLTWQASDNGAHSVDGAAAIQTVEVAASFPADWIDYSDWTGDPVEFLAKIRIDESLRHRAFMIFQASGTDADGPVAISLATVFRWQIRRLGGSVAILVFATPGGAANISDGDTVVLGADDTDWLWVRGRLTSTQISMKVWLDGTSEPGAYQAVATAGGGIDLLDWLLNGSSNPGTPCNVFAYRSLAHASNLGTNEIDSLEFISGVDCGAVGDDGTELCWFGPAGVGEDFNPSPRSHWRGTRLNQAGTPTWNELDIDLNPLSGWLWDGQDSESRGFISYQMPSGTNRVRLRGTIVGNAFGNTQTDPTQLPCDWSWELYDGAWNVDTGPTDWDAGTLVGSGTINQATATSSSAGWSNPFDVTWEPQATGAAQFYFVNTSPSGRSRAGGATVCTVRGVDGGTDGPRSDVKLPVTEAFDFSFCVDSNGGGGSGGEDCDDNEIEDEYGGLFFSGVPGTGPSGAIVLNGIPIAVKAIRLSPTEYRIGLNATTIREVKVDGLLMPPSSWTFDGERKVIFAAPVDIEAAVWIRYLA